MAFENLTQKLQNAFKRLRGKGRLSEADVKEAMKEVRMALLEADVNFKVAKQFTKTIEEKAVGNDILQGLNPAQMVVKLVNDELVSLMGEEGASLRFAPGKSVTTVMLCGLQGAGKTTTAVKLALKLKEKGKKSLIAACDVYRPAAIEQLKVTGAKAEVEVFSLEGSTDPVQIAEKAFAHAKEHGHTMLIIDTAGRLHIDEAMMEELVRIRERVEILNTLLVVDAMTGQDAVNVAREFEDKVGLDGVIMTKLDGDARGGAALSVKTVVGKPILYAGVGEKLQDFEEFHPERMASRILGMGDVLSLIEKAERNLELSEEESKEIVSKASKGKFDFNDYLMSLEQMKKMGGISSILSMLPGLGAKMPDIESQVDDKKLAHTAAIVYSMTPEERKNPKLLNPRRKFRIAKGAGLDVSEVNRFIKQFEQSQKMMKQFTGGKRRGGFPFGGLGGLGGPGGKMPF